MKTLELAQRLVRNLKVKDIAKLTADQSLVLLDAINGGIQQFYTCAPDAYRTTTLSGMLTGPMTVSLGMNIGDNLFTGYEVGTDKKGCTIRIEGDEVDNQVTSGNSLLNDFQGYTGTKSATLFGDCIGFDGYLMRMSSHPVLNGTIQLKAKSFLTRKEIGQPKYYAIEAVGQSQGANPDFYIRVDPLPDKVYTLSFTGELTPKRFTMDDLTANATLPVKDCHIETMLVPLCAGQLAESDLWALEATRKLAMDKATEAVKFCFNLPEEISLITGLEHRGAGNEMPTF
jgi:hypothetical protein